MELVSHLNTVWQYFVDSRSIYTCPVSGNKAYFNATSAILSVVCHHVRRMMQSDGEPFNSK